MIHISIRLRIHVFGALDVLFVWRDTVSASISAEARRPIRLPPTSSHTSPITADSGQVRDAVVAHVQPPQVRQPDGAYRSVTAFPQSTSSRSPSAWTAVSVARSPPVRSRPACPGRSPAGTRKPAWLSPLLRSRPILPPSLPTLRHPCGPPRRGDGANSYSSKAASCSASVSPPISLATDRPTASTSRTFPTPPGTTSSTPSPSRNGCATATTATTRPTTTARISRKPPSRSSKMPRLSPT